MKTMIRSILALTVICIVVSAVLGVVNHFTAPLIAENQKKEENAALLIVMPDANGFEEVDLSDLPNGSSVKAVYRESTGQGYVFRMEVTGYQPGLTVMCGIKADGSISGVRTLSCNETAGYGLKATEEWYTAQYTGQFSDLSGVGDISGATLTSKAYRRAIMDAFSAFAAYSGVQMTLTEDQLIAQALPDGKNPSQAVITSSLPDQITAVFTFENNAGYVFRINIEETVLYLAVDPSMREIGRAFSDAQKADSVSEEALHQILSDASEVQQELLLPYMRKVMPQAESFVRLAQNFDTVLSGTVSTQYNGDTEISAQVVSVYQTDAGYVFLTKAKGQHEGLYILCGIGADGAITGSTVYAHQETAGLGDQIAEKEYTDRYIGRTDDAVTDISGATVSSSAFRLSVQSAFAAYRMITRGEQG